MTWEQLAADLDIRNAAALAELKWENSMLRRLKEASLKNKLPPISELKFEE